MRLSLSVKLGIAVILTFGLLLGALLLYKPLQIRYHASKFNSKNIEVRVTGVDALLRLGPRGREALGRILPGGSEAAELLIKAWKGKDPALNPEPDINRLPDSESFLARSPLLQAAKREFAETARLILAKHGRLTLNQSRDFNSEGIKYRNSGDDPAAWAFYNLAIIIDPKFHWPYNNRGNVKTDLEDYEGALQDYGKAIRLNPQYSIAYANRGKLKRLMKKYDEALEDCNKAVELDNESNLARSNRIAVYLETLDLESALPDYNKRVKDSPGNSFRRIERGYVFFDCEKYEEAVVDFKKIIQINGQYDHQALYAFFRICLISIRTGNASLARKDAKECLKGFNIDQEWTKTMLRFLAGRITEAELIRATTEVKDRSVPEQRCEAYYYIAEMRRAAGDIESAKKLYEKCVATKVTNYTEYRSSRCELKRIAEREKK